MVRPQQQRRRGAGSLCPCVVYLNDDVHHQDALDGPVFKVTCNNDEKVHFYLNDDERSCSEESSIDERDLFELWRHYDEDSISDDSRDDFFDIDDSSTTESNCLLDEITSAPDRKQEKRVKFGTVTVREYDLTVGAYSAARDTCPLQLSWASAQPSVYTVDYHNFFKEFGKKRALRRLSLEKRRQRVAKVQGVSPRAVLQQEYEMALMTIQDSIKCISVDLTHTATEKSLRWSVSGSGHPKLGHDNLFTKSLLREMPPLPL